MRTAVIDLGTNTSNLVVADLREGSANICFQGKEYVRLGDKQISNNKISEAAMQRALAAIEKQVAKAMQLKASIIKIVATSAVRHAENQAELAKLILESTGVPIEVVSGDREAHLIYQGVKLALGAMEETSAIVDIGGGSNEIIICQNGNIHWKGSFAAGMTRVIHQFPISNPIEKKEIEVIAGYFIDTHKSALEACRQFGATTLIGCSGAFSTLSDLLEGVDPEVRFRKRKEILLSDFMEIYHKILRSTIEERRNFKGMDEMRTDLIVPALILGKTLIEETSVGKIIHTGFALREGVLHEMVNGRANLQPSAETSSADRES